MSLEGSGALGGLNIVDLLLGRDDVGWISIGLKLLPYIVSCVGAVEQFLKGGQRGEEKESAAIGMVHAILQTVEVGADRDLLNDSDVNKATREVMQAVVALQNVIASKRGGS
jgi:hypothetical protein